MEENADVPNEQTGIGSGNDSRQNQGQVKSASRDSCDEHGERDRERDREKREREEKRERVIKVELDRP
ncbi:hypothetical protein AOLI_G00065590 [Acnodon oligacanthus]